MMKVCVSHCPNETYSPYGAGKLQQSEAAIKARMRSYCDLKEQAQNHSLLKDKV